MFEAIDPDLFADAVHEIFSVLDRRYVGDLCKELHPRLQATFELAYETRFVILDNETCKPVNVNAVLKTYDAAEDVLKILGDDKNMIGHLLIER